VATRTPAAPSAAATAKATATVTPTPSPTDDPWVTVGYHGTWEGAQNGIVNEGFKIGPGQSLGPGIYYSESIWDAARNARDRAEIEADKGSTMSDRPMIIIPVQVRTSVVQAYPSYFAPTQGAAIAHSDKPYWRVQGISTRHKNIVISKINPWVVAERKVRPGIPIVVPLPPAKPVPVRNHER
jgi:hypothetical protein